MKKWWMWFILSGLWVLVAFLNLRDGRNGYVIIFNFLAAVLMTGLGFSQYFCEKHQKEKLLKYIYIAAVILLMLYFLFVLLFR